MKYTEDNLSLVIPSRNNLKYAKWGYKAIRNVSTDIWICYADDASDDGFWEWIQEIKKTDSRVKALRNEGPLREGHTILYDSVVNELVETDLACIYHCDMFCFENTFKNALKHMGEKTIVSMTRVEPPLHPDGPEKHLFDMGVEPEEFKEAEVKEFVKRLEQEYKNITTEGIFAPWIFNVSDFKEIGGHDEGFYPQSKEDSDIFNRFVLNGVKVIQSRDSFVAHLTCRGSRRNPNLTTVTQDSSEWLEHNNRSTRNFIRKWGHFCKHDEYMKPIIPHKYDIALRVNTDVLSDENAFQFLGTLEPWCSLIGITNSAVVDKYIEVEQENTKFDLRSRVMVANNKMGGDQSRLVNRDVYISFNSVEFLKDQKQNMQFIQQLPEILEDSGEVGEMEFGCFEITISSLETYENELIHCENTGWRRENHK